MGSLVEESGKIAKRLLCKLADNGPYGDNWLGRAYGKNGARNLGLGAGFIVPPLKAKFCDGGSGSDDGFFPGGKLDGLGQCPTKYNVKGRVRIKTTSSGSISTNDFNIGTVDGPNRLFGPLTLRFISRASAPTIRLSVRGFNPPGTAQGYSVGQYNELSQTLESFDITSVTRLDGGEDNCGDKGDSRPHYEGPVTYENNGVTVTQNVKIVVGDPKDKGGKGGLTIPIGVFAPEVKLKGEVDFENEGGINFNPPGSDDGTPGADPRSPRPPKMPDDDPPPSEGMRELLGVIVVTTRTEAATTTTEYGNGSPPLLLLPRCASLVFAVKINCSENWMKPIDIEVKKQWVPVPGTLPAYFAEVKPMNGYLCEVYPVYTDSEEESEDDEPIPPC